MRKETCQFFISYFCRFLIVLILFFLSSTQNNYVKADCPESCGCNGPGEYCCQGGQMCCTGGGCPTYMCAQAGCDPAIYNGSWSCCGWYNAGNTATEAACINRCSFDVDYSWSSGSRVCRCQSCRNNYCGRANLGGGTCGWCVGPPPPPPCNADPCTPTPTAPANGANIVDTNDVTFQWTGCGWGGNSCGSRSFRVQVDNNNNFSSPEYDSGNLNENVTSQAATLYCTDSNITYYWRVAANNNHVPGGTVWSAVRNFNIICYPPHGTIQYPADGAGTTYQYIYTGNPYYAQATGTDASPNGSGRSLRTLIPYRRKDANRDGTYEGVWTDVSDASTVLRVCGDSSPCSLPLPNNQGYRRWIPAPSDEGLWQWVINVHSNDEDGTNIGRCTGNPTIQPANLWTQCNAGIADQKEFTVLNPPTATVTCPAGPLIPNTAYTFSATGSDSGANLRRMGLYRRSNSGAGPFVAFNPEVSFANTNFYALNNQTWTPTSADIGTWLVYPNAYDELEAYGGRCTGNTTIPGGNPPWSDCGRPNLTNDSCLVTVRNDPPICTSITSPSSVRSSTPTGTFLTHQRSGLFNVQVSDVNNHEIRNIWSSNNCPVTRSTISKIEIVARGDNYNGWPIMRVMTSDANGVRSQACADITVGSNVYTTYTCDLNPDRATSSIDVIFTNDAWGGPGLDRNLYVDNIRIYYPDSAAAYTTIHAEDKNVNGNFVVLDRATGVNETLYDGITTIPSQEAIPWVASLRFPVPVTFSPAAPGTCNISVTVSDQYNGSNTCSKNVNVCGSNPDKATGLSPDNELDVPIDGSRPLTWNALANWGDICTTRNNTYTVIGRATSATNAAECMSILSERPQNCNGSGCSNYTSVCQGTAATCNNAYFQTRNQNYCWAVITNNGEYYNMSDVKWFETDDPLYHQNWVTAIEGNFYAGSLSMRFPDITDYVDAWRPPYTTNLGTISTRVSGQTSFETNVSSQSPNPQSESGLWGENFRFSQPWPLSPGYKGVPPKNATEITGANCALAFSSPIVDSVGVFTMDVACANQAVATPVYKIKTAGTAIVYVTGSGDFKFSQSFVGNTANDRVLFVTGDGVNVKIDKNLQAADEPPIKTTAPVITAAFLVAGENNGSFTIEGINDPANPGDPEADPDSSVVIEGPVIFRRGFFYRNRGSGNAYPSEVVRYNPLYLYKLTEQERTSSDTNYSGLFQIDVDWIEE